MEKVISVRIIPARAGFTNRELSVNRLIGDHPRSRGVYSDGSGEGVQEGGSSPFARGLRYGIP